MTTAAPPRPPRTHVGHRQSRRRRTGPLPQSSLQPPAVDPWRRMALSFFGMLCGALLTVAAITLWVDPLGIVRGDAARTVSEEPLYRSWKVELLAGLRKPPQVLLLGSSTMRDIDPQHVRRLTAQRAFNASVSGGSPIDSYALAAYAAERFPGSFPHVVMGIDVDVTFRDLDPSPALLRDPALARQFSIRERARIAGSVYRPYMTWGTLRTALRARGTEPGRLERPAHEVFRADGYRLWDPYRHTALRRRLPRETARYESNIYRSGEFRVLSRSSKHYVERVIGLANEHGDVPTLVLMPVHPWAQQRLAPYGWRAHRAQVLAYLQQLASEGSVHVVDMSDIATFGGTPVDFRDNVHLTEPNARRLVRALSRQGALGATR